MERMIFLSLGSNLGDRINFLEDALQKIENRCGKVTLKSDYYETEPIGFKSEDQFINICVGLETELNPTELLTATQQIEQESGREKSRIQNEGYQSRNLDIDIIFFRSEIISTFKLSIPHPRFQDRRFVLEPLNDIAPNFIDPSSNKTVNSLLNTCNDDSIVSKIKN